MRQSFSKCVLWPQNRAFLRSVVQHATQVKGHAGLGGVVPRMPVWGGGRSTPPARGRGHPCPIHHPRCDRRPDQHAERPHHHDPGHWEAQHRLNSSMPLEKNAAGIAAMPSAVPTPVKE